MLMRKWFASILLLLCGAFGEETYEIQNISVMKGDSVSLHINVDEVNIDMQILWLFGAENPDTLIAEIYDLKISIYDSYKELKDRLQMNKRTGSLTIKNITNSHSGFYKAQIMTAITVFRIFNVTVYAPVSFPVIESSSLISNCQTYVRPAHIAQGYPCTMLCSAENGPGVSLSWYKDGEMLKQISSPDLNVNLSVLLEIKERNENMYHCVSANPVSNKTIQINLQEHCPQHTDFCGFTEIAIRLVVSALVGVATLAILIYDIRSGREVDQMFQC